MFHRTKRITLVFLSLYMLMTAGVCRIALGDPETAPASLQQQAIQRIEHYIEHFRKTGDQAALLEELQQADSELTASSDAFKRTNDLASAALSLIKRGDVKRMQDHWQQALEDYKEAAHLAQSAAHLTYQAQALIGQAKAAFDGRDYGAATAAIEQAVQLSARSGDQKTRFDALIQMSYIQSSQGDLNAAADAIALALDVALDDRSRLYGHLYRGNVYLERARKCHYDKAFAPCYEALDRARADYTQTLAFATQLEYTALAQQTEGFLQEVEQVRAVLHKQEGSHTEVLQQTIFHPKTPGDVLVLEQFLFSHPLDPDVSKSIKQSKGFADADNALNFYLQGLTHKMQGDDDAALAAHLKAVELLEADRRQLRDERSRGTFLEDKIQLYYEAIRHLLNRRRFAEAFALLERSRARAMADLLTSQPLGLSRPEERALYAAWQQSKAEIARGQQKLFELRSEADHDQKTDKISTLELDLQVREGAYQLLLSRIAKDAPKLLELGVSQPVSLQMVQQSMQADHYEVLSYLILEDLTILWHISGNAVHVRAIFLPRSQLIDKVTRLRRSLEKDNSFDEQTAKELFLFLIQPARQWITSTHLVIIPHEALNGVPFQVFQDPADNSYLGERFQLTYAPSATILLQLKQLDTLAGGRLLAIANPGIPKAQEEVTAIATLYPNAQKVVTDRAVTKADLKAWAGDYDLLHLSVHGTFKEEAPLLSYLDLSKSGQEDGKLTAAEMFGLPLTKTRLVVLSACETGRVEATHANETLGMMRALLYAGANTLILSSWSVDAASTTLWMQTFYQEAQTKPVREAARLALMAVKNRPEYTHPFYWGPFLVIGK